jgi:hypothetical protein
MLEVGAAAPCAPDGSGDALARFMPIRAMLSHRFSTADDARTLPRPRPVVPTRDMTHVAQAAVCTKFPWQGP